MADAALDPAGILFDLGLRLWSEAFERSHVAVSVVDAVDETFVLVNPAYAAQRGYRPEELIGRSIWMLVPEELHDAIRLGFTEAGRMGHRIYESEHLCRDGRRMQVQVDATALPDAEGIGRYRLAIVTDISERKRAEAALRESERMYRLIVETAYEGIRISSPDGILTFVNDRFAQMLGYRVDEIVGRATIDFAHEGWEPAARQINTDLGAGLVVQGEFKFRRKDGSALWTSFNATAIYDEQGRRQVANIGMHTDITERRRAQDALAESEQLLRAITDAVPETILVINRDHTVRYLNRAGLALVAAARGEALTLKALRGMTRIEVFGDTPGERERLAADERVMANGEEARYERRVPGPDGERQMMAHVVPLRDVNGQVTGRVGITVDISRQKQGEERRVAAITRQRDALVREVHHRIKNHLHGVAGLLRHEASVHPALAPLLADVLGQINAIAAVYGLQAVGNEMAADLDRMARLVTAGAAGPVQYRGLDGAPLSLREADAVPVALVVNELVTNALKHRSDAAANRPVRVTLQRSGEDLLLTVAAGPARLPPGFDFAARQGLGTGLELAATLLPSQGASLTIVQDGDEVRAELRLQASLWRAD